ncbi:MAG TPA: hypothetical protein PLF40_13665 [Kofleriaceae bacterium]|nr:hypothetical protein [Kofleriaceae bacterium]
MQTHNVWAGAWCVLLAACGAAPASRPVASAASTQGAGPKVQANRPATAAEVTPQTYCADVARLAAAKCDALNIAPEDADPALCEEGVRRALYDRTADAREVVETIGSCLKQDCAGATECIAQAHEGWEKNRGRRRACSDEDTSGVVALDAKQWANRTGATAQRFSDVATTPAMPIEVCELEGQLRWLTSMRCDDGSQPFHSFAEAHVARVRNIGPAGRCNSIVDLYQVTCPERTYDVYMDLYMCPAQ